MFEDRLRKLALEIQDLSREYSEMNQSNNPKAANLAAMPEWKDMQHRVNILRRDVDDLHSIFMLRSAAEKIPKKNRIVFIGTGQINENVIHAYIHFQKAVQRKEINFDGEAFFVARTQIEYDLLKNYGLPCEIWRHQPELSVYLLETKVVVLSSHLYSHWGDNLLCHSTSSAIKIELWHGLPAKTIGASCITNGMNFHHFARLLEDSVNTQHVCIQNANSDVVNEYRRAFPYAKQYPTGDCRTDILFNEQYRSEFLKNKADKRLVNWLAANKDKMKVLYTPTYRETPQMEREHREKMFEMVAGFDRDDIKLAIKLHVGIRLSNEEKNRLADLCNAKGHLFIDSTDEVYSTFNDFDAIIVDYSSIRSDFALTGKPIFLWRFDQKGYHRPTDVVAAFEGLDKVSYEMDDRFSVDKLVTLLKKDPNKAKRQAFVEKELKTFSNGSSAKLTIQVFLDVMNAN